MGVFCLRSSPLGALLFLGWVVSLPRGRHNLVMEGRMSAKGRLTVFVPFQWSLPHNCIGCQVAAVKADTEPFS